MNSQEQVESCVKENLSNPKKDLKQKTPVKEEKQAKEKNEIEKDESCKTAQFTQEKGKRKKSTKDSQKSECQSNKNVCKPQGMIRQRQIEPEEIENEAEAEKFKSTRTSKKRNDESYYLNDRRSTGQSNYSKVHNSGGNFLNYNYNPSMGTPINPDYENIQNGNFYGNPNMMVAIPPNMVSPGIFPVYGGPPTYSNQPYNPPMPQNYYPQGIPSQNVSYVQPNTFQSTTNAIPSQMPISNDNIINQTEFLQMKISLINFESENIALKETIKELQNSLKEKSQVIQSLKNKESSLCENDTKVRELSSKLEAKAKEISEYKAKYENILKENERKDRLLEVWELQDEELSEKKDTLAKEMENLHKEINRKDELIKRVNDDYENLKKHLDTLKKDNLELRENNEKANDENKLNWDRINELETEKLYVEKRLHNEEIKWQNCKLEIENFQSSYNSLKRNYDINLEHYEILRNENFKLKTENEELILNLEKMQNSSYKTVLRNNRIQNENRRVNFSRQEEEELDNLSEVEDPNFSVLTTSPNKYNFKKITTKESNEQMPSNYNRAHTYQPKTRMITVNLEDRNKFSKTKGPKVVDDFCLPSEKRIRRHKTDIDALENMIAGLTSEKTNIENELFKIPTSQKSVSQINKKRKYESKLMQIEKEITACKIRLKEIMKK